MTLGVEFLHTLYQCRELSTAVARYATDGTLQIIRENLGLGVEAIQALLCKQDVIEVSPRVTQVVELVLQDVERPDFAHASPPTSLGSEVLSLIADATCGGPPLPHSSFMQRMLASTLAQARAARDLCVASLLDSVSSDNSISLLAVSEACGCAALSRRARS
ncbi:hypothetical protein H632_c2846p0, partial [Helicosporidium sp. ATCC 50920]